MYDPTTSQCNFGFMQFQINWGSVFIILHMWEKVEYEIVILVATH